MKKNILIVESPAKVKTISKYLGPDFDVLASYGHVRDLKTKDSGVDVENNFKPSYEVIKGKESFLKQLKAAVKADAMVWLATDPDREGEAIAWHIMEAAKLKDNRVKRVVFNEITKTAVTEAMKQARSINQMLVDAQQARRILDRLVGFEMSPLLWRKVQAGLSAGRVQSVATRLLVERELDIQAFQAQFYFAVSARFKLKNGQDLQANYEPKLESEDETRAFLEALAPIREARVAAIKKTESLRKPPPPFTTSSLQQEAARRGGFSVTRTMSVAQKLYEAGHITYMRTDSMHMAKEAVASAASYIKGAFEERYLKTRHYQSKIKGAQEAHECIRPTNFSVKEAGSDPSEKKLYQMIWERALASQMSEAVFAKTELKLQAGNVPFVAKGEVRVFDGFLAVLSSHGAKDQELPALSEGDTLGLNEVVAHQKATRHKARYTEASLVKKLEELGIGRPSTYAPTISTIQKRTYAIKGDIEGKSTEMLVLRLDAGTISEERVSETLFADSGKLIPSDLGMVVTEFLTKEFEEILNYHFTASIEEKFDQIAKKELPWQEMLSQFYEGFHKRVNDVKEHAERVSGERKLGEDSKSGKPVYVRVGKFGPLAQLGERAQEEGDEKPQFASIPEGLRIASISLEEALALFDFPKRLGQLEGQDVLVCQGRFGPYLKWDKTNVSLKDVDPLAIELNEAIKLIEEKKEADKNRYIHQFSEVKPGIDVINGPYGPYIQQGKKRARIPKEIEAKSITLELAQEILADEKNISKRRRKK